MLRKMLCCILCCIAILCLTATPVFAYGYFNGSDEPASISFDFSDGAIPVTGGTIQLRQIAFWNDEQKRLNWCEGYEDCGLSLEDPFGDDSADWLYVYARGASLPAQDIQIGADGKVTVENLVYGFYLVSQELPFEGYNALKPALISVPLEIESQQWLFAVEAKPKLEPLVPETSEPETTVPSTTEPGTPSIPKTGQTNWPIPILLLAGSVLIILGLCLRREKRHET